MIHGPRGIRRLLLISVALLAAACGSDSDHTSGAERAAAAAPEPPASLRGPITEGLRGHALWDSWFDLSEVGYAEEEFFVSGQARSASGEADAPYTTRLILRRPIDPERFNGTVLLDWVNVTAQFENAVDTLNAQQFLLREGYAFAHVSVQAAGICCLPALTPKLWDPVRYADLDHPGDDYAFSMLNQLAQALRQPGPVDAMAGLPVRTVLAAGQSQSANQLFDMLQDGHLDATAIDGVLVHSSIGRAFTSVPPVPVIHLLSDFEARAEAPASEDNVALWEIAGSAHQDFYVGYQQVLGQGLRAAASLPQRPASAYFDMQDIAGNYGDQPHPLHAACILAGAAFPMRYAVAAAIHHLNIWAGGGPRPPRGERYAFDANGALATDRFGNALGGIRLPPVEVPVARYQSTSCGLGGITIPFTRLQLGAEYGTHADYFCAMKAATAQSVADGFLLAEDAEDLMQRARGMRNRFLVNGSIDCD